MNFFEIEEKDLEKSKVICHSGGALGSDTEFEKKCSYFGIQVRAYSYKTNYHNSPNKFEISDEDYLEGVNEINKANKILRRYNINKFMNLLARNWSQVKYSEQIFAVGSIVDPKKKSKSGYYSKSDYQTVDGGTGYACMMAVLHQKELFVFDQEKLCWFRWSYPAMKFVKCENPVITKHNFAGIGTRQINDDGIKAISSLFERTFKN